MLAVPILKQVSGQKIEKYNLIPITSNFHYSKKKGRREFVRVKMVNKKNKLSLLKFPKVGAGILTSATWSTGIAIPVDQVAEVNIPAPTLGNLSRLSLFFLFTIFTLTNSLLPFFLE